MSNQKETDLFDRGFPNYVFSQSHLAVYLGFSIQDLVKDSNVDLGVIFWIVQNPPITKAVCTKFFF